MIRASRNLLAMLLLAAIGAAISASPAAAVTAAPAWRIESYPAPAHFTPGLSTGQDMYIIEAVNSGGATTDGSTVTVTDELPPGFSMHVGKVAGTSIFAYITSDRQVTDGQAVTLVPCDSGPPVTCEFPHAVVPGERLSVFLSTDTPASGPSELTNHITVSGGGAAPASVTEETPFNSEPVLFGMQAFHTSLTDLDGGPVTQAGAHPFSFRVGFGINNEIKPSSGFIRPVENLKDAGATLAPGLVINPSATPHCTEVQLESDSCPNSSAVGVIDFSATKLGAPASAFGNSLFNMVTPPGAAASFGFNAVGFGLFFHVLGGVDPARNYALKGETLDITQLGGLNNFVLDLWGNPSDPGHEHIRGECASGNESEACPVPANPTPFIDMPSACSGPLQAHATATFWQSGVSESQTTQTTDAADPPNPVGVTGCEALEFEPTLSARPTTNVADSPSGLEADLHIPQSENVETLSTSDLKDVTVKLPRGLTINPSSGNGLDGCSSSQIGLATDVGASPIRFKEGEPSCPPASRLGTLEVTTPLVDHALPGSVFLAKPFDNPFSSLLAIYLVIDDPQTGVVVKLPGRVEADPQSGQLTTTFTENPQLPVEELKVSLFGGSGGALRTPAACGTYATESTLTPWTAPESGPPVKYEDSWQIEAGPGGSCPESEASQPSSPSFDAGSEAPLAGTYSPLLVNLRREDGTQQFSSLKLSPPPGLIGKLAGIPACPDSALAGAGAKSGRAEEASPSCPAASKVGSVVVGAGSGPAPYYAKGNAYLAGPYKGAPLSFAVIVPATAGPFDLGTVLNRVAINVDPATAQITADADPLPQILEGIPLDVRSIAVRLDRPQFTRNPTSCDPTSFGGELGTTFGVTNPLQSRFQLGECGRLGFKPKMALALKGPIKRGRYPKLTAVLTMPEGDADIASVSVALPHSEFLAQEHIRTICTRVQFAADQCPAGAVYGQATVQTPLLDYPLSGNVYLRASDNKLPDLVPDLRGPSWQPLRLEADGRTDSINGGLRNSFELIPDAPFSKFTLQLQGSTKGLLQNSTNICASPQRATVKYTAHNGDTYVEHPLLRAQCPKARKGRGAHHHKRSAHTAK